eukprot:11212916-Lingulodinium_polyedra.AAC.1
MEGPDAPLPPPTAPPRPQLWQTAPTPPGLSANAPTRLHMAWSPSRPATPAKPCGGPRPWTHRNTRQTRGAG